MTDEINRVNEEFNKFREGKQSIFNKRIEFLSKMLSLMFPLLLLVFLQINKYLTPYTYSLYLIALFFLIISFFFSLLGFILPYNPPKGEDLNKKIIKCIEKNTDLELRNGNIGNIFQYVMNNNPEVENELKKCYEKYLFRIHIAWHFIFIHLPLFSLLTSFGALGLIFINIQALDIRQAWDYICKNSFFISIFIILLVFFAIAVAYLIKSSHYSIKNNKLYFWFAIIIIIFILLFPIIYFINFLVIIF